MIKETDIYDAKHWYARGAGPRYQQFGRHLADIIRSGLLPEGARLPTERDIVKMTNLSRVTIRKAMAQLAASNLIERRQGVGSFVKPDKPKLQQSLSSLVSFTETMKMRDKISSSRVLLAGLFMPNPDEMMVLGLGAGERVARVKRLRSADNMPMALETSSLPFDILPNPEQVSQSLYAVLRSLKAAPTRAIQRVTATNLTADDAAKLDMDTGAAALLIERTAYLSTGRPIEFTRGIYRPDSYDFVSELRACPSKMEPLKIGTILRRKTGGKAKISLSK